MSAEQLAVEDLKARTSDVRNESVLYQKLSQNLSSAYSNPAATSDFRGATGYNVERYNNWPAVSLAHEEEIKKNLGVRTIHSSAQLHTRIAFKQKTYSKEDLDKLPPWIDIPDFQAVE